MDNNYVREMYEAHKEHEHTIISEDRNLVAFIGGMIAITAIVGLELDEVVSAITDRSLLDDVQDLIKFKEDLN